MKFSKKQLEKIADQARLLAWGQGAILTSSLHMGLNWMTMSLVFVFWAALQAFALYVDKRSES